MSYRVITPTQMKQIWYEFSRLVEQKQYQKIPYQDWKIYNKLIDKTKLELGYNYIVEFIYKNEDVICYIGMPQVDNTYYISKPFFSRDNSFGKYLYHIMVGCDRYSRIYSHEDDYDWDSSGLTIDPESPGYRTRFNLENTLNNYEVSQDVNTIDLTYLCPSPVTNRTSIEYTCDTYSDNISTLTKQVQELADKLENKNKEGNKTMFNFDFGPINGDYIRMSPYGMAVRNAEGKYVAYDKANGKIMDVDVFNFNGDGLLYKIPSPIKDIHSGDIVIHNKKPMYVKAVIVADNTLSVVDIFNGESKNILLSRSPFGFDYATRVVSVLDGFGGTTANSDNPFGNMLPLLMLNDDQAFDPLMLLLMGGNNGNMMNNPLMLYALMNKDGKGKNDMLPFLLMMNNNSNHTCECNIGHA